MNTLRKLLHDPRVQGVDTDSTELVEVHRQILQEKPMMRRVFRRFYHALIEQRLQLLPAAGMELEIGSGASFFKDVHPALITTDIKPTPYVDRVLDAQDMDLEDNSVAALYGINCFHHFPRPRAFFYELQRVLKPGGGCLLIEPYYGPLASRLYRAVHANEHFNKAQEHWEKEDLGPMTGANQALSYVVFERDEALFRKEFPQLQIAHRSRLDNPLQYLCSGGVNFKQLVPSSL